MSVRASIILLLIFVAGTVSAQRKKTENIIPPPPPSNDTNYACDKKHNLSASERLKNYPFNKAKSVMLVSFDNNFLEYIISPGSKDTTTSYNYGGKLPVENDTLCFSKLKEKIILSKAQIDSLTDILFNYDFKGEVNYGINHDCYEPHNAIVFLNAKDKMFEFIEICFLCDGNRTSSKRVSTGKFCGGKYELLRDYFSNVGLRIGVTPRRR